MPKATLPGVAGAMGGMRTGPTKGSRGATAPAITPMKGAPKPRVGPMVLSPSRSGAGMHKTKAPKMPAKSRY